MVKGTGHGSGRRLTKVTDGLRNTVDIVHDHNRSNIVFGANCGVSLLGNSPRCLRSMGPLVSQVVRGTTSGEDFGLTEYSYEVPATADFLRGYFFASRTIVENSSPTEAGARQQIAHTTEDFGQALDNGLFPEKYTYPFQTKPTRSLTRLSLEPDLDGSIWGRWVEETHTYEVLIGTAFGAPHLNESTRTVYDEVVEDVVEVVRRHDVFTPGIHGLPLVHEQSVYTGASATPIASFRVHTARDPDPARWILDRVEALDITSTRNGVSRTKHTTFELDDETGFVTAKIEDRAGDERDLRTEYTPDSFGNVHIVKQISVDGERITTTDYGERGIYPLTVENAEGHIRHYEFDDVWGSSTLTEDENGYQIVEVYDGFGRLTHREAHNGDDVTNLADITYSSVAAPYDVDGVIIPAALRKNTTSDTFAGEATEDFDSRGLLVRAKVPGIGVDGGTPELFTESLYDWAGRSTLRSAPHEAATSPIWSSVVRDLRGRPIQVTSPAANLEFRYSSWVHFAESFPEWDFPDSLEATASIDAEGKQRVTIVDHNDSIVLAASGVDLDGTGSGFVTRTTRGPRDLPIALIDPEQHQTVMEYDNDSLMSWTEDENRGRTDFFYDAYGNMKRIIEADLVESEFTYDRIDRPLTRIDDGDALTEWAYDTTALGRLGEMTGPTGIRTVLGYEDSPRGLPTSAAYHVSDETFTSSVAFNPLGRATRVVYPSVPRPGDDFEFAVRPEYDPHSGQLVAIQSDDLASDYWRITDIDGRGRLHEITLGNGVRESYDFDPTTQLISDIRVLDDTSELSHLSYDYYANGQVHERTLVHGAVTRSRTLTYDSARRLDTVSESGPDAVDEAFGFSPAGRLESRSKFGNYTPDVDHPHALGSVAGNDFTYDARGNQETRTGPNIVGGTQTITYTRFGLPDEILLGDPDSPDRAISFEYDAAGKRVAKRESNGGPEVLSIGNGYERTTGGTGDPSVQHLFRIFANGREIAELAYDEATEESVISYLHRDQQMSVLFTTNSSRESSELRDFDVFGEPVESPSWTDVTKGSFTGHQRDAEIGLVNAGARLYDSVFGVFTGADPMRVSGVGSQAFNPYAYAGNDPVNMLDPTGLQTEGTEVVVRGCRAGGTWPHCNDGERQIPDNTQMLEWAIRGHLQPTELRPDLRFTQPTFIVTNVDPLYHRAPWPWNATQGLLPGPGDVINPRVEVDVPVPIIPHLIRAADGRLSFEDRMLAGSMAVIEGGTFVVLSMVGAGPAAGVVTRGLAAEGGTVARGAGAAAFETQLPKSLYYYANSETAALVESTATLGQAGRTLYLTPNGALSPLQAGIELALPQKNTAVALFRVSTSALDKSQIIRVGTVTGNVFGRGGGGIEVLYNSQIPLRFVTRLR
jgi:RHS repeat-associated protein